MHRVIIIGSGPAGLTAAIYTARAGLAPLVIEGSMPGGQLTTTTVIENWPGTPDGIDGVRLMEDMKKQAQRFNVVFKSGEVRGIEVQHQPYRVLVGAEQFETKSIIIATGASPRFLGLPAEQILLGRGVSVCATCDGFFFKNKNVLVIGGGDTALEEAIYLSSLAASVTVVHRRDSLRASRIMQERAFNIRNISFLWDSIVVDIQDTRQKKVTGAFLRNVKTGEITFRHCDGIFLALGHVPNSAPFKDHIACDQNGFIIIGPGTATSVPGIFAAGDVADPVYKQAITAAGMGCMAAIDAERYLQTCTG
ncbi:MAG: thioredoxin-disulfide reductase [Desulfobacterota bacterium]|nr:thioredoxin-disulfide reductase [Thermodesulfobacteriota bacterium]